MLNYLRSNKIEVRLATALLIMVVFLSVFSEYFLTMANLTSLSQ